MRSMLNEVFFEWIVVVLVLIKGKCNYRLSSVKVTFMILSFGAKSPTMLIKILDAGYMIPFKLSTFYKHRLT